MADLNEWRLAYDAINFTFGTFASTYPLSAQVELGSVDIEDQDQRHPTGDGEVAGRDMFGGFDLTFKLTTLPTYPAGATPWRTGLDLLSAFKSKWRANSVRKIPGKYATLINVDRDRMVYGRPRAISQDMKLARRGVLGYVALFHSMDPNFYGATEKSVTVTPVPASSGGGLVAPLIAPLITIGSSDDDSAVQTNAGDEDTWPIIEFKGPGNNHSVDFVVGTTTVWSITAADSLKYDEVLRIDTRPWSRSATLNGLPANGRIRGSQIEKCTIPPGSFSLRYKVSDATGTANVKVMWRDAFASL